MYWMALYNVDENTETEMSSMENFNPSMDK